MSGRKATNPYPRVRESLRYCGYFILQLVGEVRGTQPMRDRKPCRKIGAAKAEQPPRRCGEEIRLKILDELKISTQCVRWRVSTTLTDRLRSIEAIKDIKGCSQSGLRLRGQHMTAKDKRPSKPDWQANVLCYKSLKQMLDFARIDGAPIDRLQ
jgi:hypothetical protein